MTTIANRRRRLSCSSHGLTRPVISPPSSMTEYGAAKTWVLRQINWKLDWLVHSVMHGMCCHDDGRRSSSGSLAKFTAIPGQEAITGIVLC
jgi:hypothetical protein